MPAPRRSAPPGSIPRWPAPRPTSRWSRKDAPRPAADVRRPPRSERWRKASGGRLAHYHLGCVFRDKGYYLEAVREYRLALERGEDRALVRRAMAEVHLVRRDPASALELYDALVKEPASAKYWNERGVALHQCGRRDEAVASYRRALRGGPALRGRRRTTSASRSRRGGAGRGARCRRSATALGAPGGPPRGPAQPRRCC